MSNVVTLAQIAARLGLAHTTVSRALNDHPKISVATKLRVHEAAQAMGYIAHSGARQMRAGASRVVGLVVPDIQNDFFSAAARSMAACCARDGFQMILGVSEDDPEREEQQVRAMRESRVAGLLLAPCHAPTARTAGLLRAVPAVQFLRWHQSLGLTGVHADDTQGLLEATRHLLLLGHRRLGYIGPPRTLSTGAQRIEGFERALRQSGAPIDDGLQCFGTVRPSTGDAGLRQMLARDQPPTALVVASLQQMLGVMRAVRECEVAIPHALSLVAYGDAQWFEACNPAVTAVALPVDAMCEKATSTLFALIAAKEGGAAPEPTRLVFPTSLVVRGTTRRA